MEGNGSGGTGAVLLGLSGVVVMSAGVVGGEVELLIETTATVTMEPVNGAPTVTSSHLVTTVRIPNADKAKFQEAAENAKAGCPISRLLNTKITLDAKLA